MASTILKLQKLSIPPSGLHLWLRVRINSKAARFIIDTGASQTVLDYNRLQYFSSSEEKRKLEVITTGIGTAGIESHASLLKSIQLGDLKIKNQELILLDLQHVNSSYSMMGFKPIDGILGSDLLHQYNAIVDFKKLTLKLSWKK